MIATQRSLGALALALLTTLSPLWMTSLPPFLNGAAWAICCVLTALFILVGNKAIIGNLGAIVETLKEGERHAAEAVSTMAGLADLSRRTGLSNLGSARSNWDILQVACYLVASVASEEDIRHEETRALRATDYRYVFSVQRLRTITLIFFTACILSCLILALQYPFAHLVPWCIGNVSIILILLIITARIDTIRQSELLCVTIVFEGVRCLLTNNSVNYVYSRLSQFIPPAQRGSLNAVKFIRKPQHH